MPKLFTLPCIALLLLTVSVAGQSSRDYDKGEIFAGYSGSVLDESYPQTSNWEHGFELAGVYNLKRYFGIKVDVSGTFKSVEGPYRAAVTGGTVSGNFHASHSSYHYLAGIQFKNNS